jgi:hypothetical protein
MKKWWLHMMLGSCKESFSSDVLSDMRINVSEEKNSGKVIWFKVGL